MSLDFLPVQSSVSHGNEKQMLLSKPCEEYITSKSQKIYIYNVKKNKCLCC